MSDDLAVHAALRAALAASADLAALVGTRIWDEVPDAGPNGAATLPFVVLADSRAENLAAGSPDCGAMSGIETDILIYSRPSDTGGERGSAEAKRIAWAIRQAIADVAALSAAGWIFTLQRWVRSDFRRADPDLKTFVGTVVVRTHIVEDT